MKRAVLLAAVGMLVLASCKKEFTCVCLDIDGAPVFAQESQDPVFNTSEKRAIDACNDLTTLMDSTVICGIK